MIMTFSLLQASFYWRRIDQEQSMIVGDLILFLSQADSSI